MDDDLAVELAHQQAIDLLPDTGDEIHTYLNPAPNVLLGADWSRDSILKAIYNSDPMPELAGKQATESGHGLVVWYRGDPLFVATKPNEGA